MLQQYQLPKKMKKKKLSLDEVKISSFLTSLSTAEKATLETGDLQMMGTRDSWYLICFVTVSLCAQKPTEDGAPACEEFTWQPYLLSCATTQTATEHASKHLAPAYCYPQSGQMLCPDKHK